MYLTLFRKSATCTTFRCGRSLNKKNVDCYDRHDIVDVINYPLYSWPCCRLQLVPVIILLQPRSRTCERERTRSSFARRIPPAITVRKCQWSGSRTRIGWSNRLSRQAKMDLRIDRPHLRTACTLESRTTCATCIIIIISSFISL